MDSSQFPLFGTIELAKRFPEAFNALPSAYRNDDVLDFWIDPIELDGLCLCSKEDQEFAIGRFDGFYSELRKCWVVQDENGNWRNIDPNE